MNKAKLFFIFLLISFICSCSNLFKYENCNESDDDLLSKDYAEVCFNITIPELNISSLNNYGNAKTALTTGSLLDPVSKLKIWYKKQGSASYTLLGEYGVFDNITAKMSFGYYYFKVECYNDNDLLYQSKNDNVLSVQTNGTVTIDLSMYATKIIDYTTAGSGSINLPLVTDSSIRKCIVNWKQNNILNTHEVYITDGIANFYLENIPNGSYEMEFRFYNNDGALLYRVPCEGINVACGCVTDTWICSGDDCEYLKEDAQTGKLVMNISNAMLYNASAKKNSFSKIYVDSGAPENGTGVMMDPFKDINEAVATAKEIGSNNIYLAKGSEYFVKKTIILNKDGMSIESYDALTTSSNFNKTARPKLKRYYDSSNGDKSFKDSMIKVASDSSIEVAVKGICFDGEQSYVSISCDGSIICNDTNNANLTVEDCEIMNCKTSGKGDVIYNTSKTTLINTIIKRNTNYQGGSQIYCTGSLILQGQICFDSFDDQNTAIYLLDTATSDSSNKVKLCDLIDESNLSNIKYPVIEFKNYKEFTFLFNSVNSGIMSGNPSSIAQINYKIKSKIETNGNTTEYYFDSAGKLTTKPTSFAVIKDVKESTGELPEFSKVSVSTENELEIFANWVNTGICNFSGKTVMLSDNLDLSTASEFAGIGSSSCPFKGTFDGNYKTVTLSNYSLFNYTQNAAIQNVITDGQVIGAYIIPGSTSERDSYYSGGICAYASQTTIYNCVNNADVTGSGGSNYVYAGGIAGQVNNCIIDRCINNGNIFSTKNYAGGISSQSGGSNLIIRNCTNTGKVSALGYAGGILGSFVYGYIFNCYNKGEITTTSGSSGAGIVGQYSGGTNVNAGDIQNCYNSGKVNAANIAHISQPSHENSTKINKNYYFIATESSNTAITQRTPVPSSDACEFTILINGSKTPETTEQLTVGSITSKNVVDLLNAWIDTQTDSENYLRWKADSDGFPVFDTSD